MNNKYSYDFGYTLPEPAIVMHNLMLARLEATEFDYNNGEFTIEFGFKEHTFKFIIKASDEVEDIIGEAAFQLGAAISSTYLRN